MIDDVINKIKKLCRVKSSTEIGDVVLIYSEEKNLVEFGKVFNITPDPKKDWYTVSIIFFQLPFERKIWLLKKEYFNGSIPFTMDGKFKFIGAIDFESILGPGPLPKNEDKKSRFKVIK